MSSQDVESFKETIDEVIKEKKRTGLWDPYNWQTTVALIAASRLPDKSIADFLKSQGAELSTRCLLSVVQKGNAKLLKFIIKELKKAGRWSPDDWYTGLALAEAWFFERKKLYKIFSENDVVFTPEWLITAVKYGDIGLIVKIIHGLKATNRWDPYNSFILQAISEAIKEEANIWYFCLIQEGALPCFQHLIVAVRHGDCNILKDIIQNLKKQNLWDIADHNKEIILALEEACLKKDITSYSTLIEEGAVPDFHCLFAAIKSDYYQLASRIVRDLKLSGNWNDKTLQNDWSLALAKDYIAQLPEGIRQTWENLIFDAVKTEIQISDIKATGNTISTLLHAAEEKLIDNTGRDNNKIAEEIDEVTTLTPPNTPVERSLSLPTLELNASCLVDKEKDKVGLDEYQQPINIEAISSRLQRSISVPTAAREYEVLGQYAKSQKAYKRERAGEKTRIFIFPQNPEEEKARTPNIIENPMAIACTNQTITDKQDTGFESMDKRKMLDREAKIRPMQTVSAENDLLMDSQVLQHVFINDGNNEKRDSENASPCRIPEETESRVRVPFYHSTSSSKLHTGRFKSRLQNDPEVYRLRHQFIFSIRSISLKCRYGIHLNQVSSLPR